jgi:threonine/homoserine/homoserine lactone efflux protein
MIALGRQRPIIGGPVVEASWMLFAVASLAVILTPGQDTILVMSRSIAQGPRAGETTAAGVSAGLVGHTLLAGAGVGALMRASDRLFTAFMPRFVAPAARHPTLTIFALGAAYAAMAFVAKAPVAVFAGRLSVWLRTRPLALLWAHRCSGAILLVLGIKLALTASATLAQQPIEPVDFRPFVDGQHWIVRQPLTYTIGVSKDSVTVPVGFVTDFASIPQVFQSLIRQNGNYLLPAVVHDYLYWKQTCTREQADRIFRLAMIENDVSEVHRVPIFEVVRAAGGFAWDGNARERAEKRVRILPTDRMRVPANAKWPDYQRQLAAEGAVDGPDTTVPAAFCARADLPVDEALARP